MDGFYTHVIQVKSFTCGQSNYCNYLLDASIINSQKMEVAFRAYTKTYLQD